MTHIAKFAKGYIALVGLVTQVINLNYFHGTAQNNLTVVLGILTALGVALFPNTTVAD